MDTLTIAYGVVCILGAAFVRGYSGFGFSLLAVTALSLRLPPAAIVPSIFLMEIAASIHMLPSIWREVHWRAIGVLLIGYTIAVPLGVWLLASVPEAPMKVALGVCVLIATLLLMRGIVLKRMPGTAATLATGGASGLLNGAFGTGGPPVILFFFSSPAGASIGRASVVAFFLATDAIGLVFLARQGLVTLDSVLRFAIFLPALIAGVWLGAHSFKRTDQETFRRWVLRLLALLAFLTLAQGLVRFL
ncbi:MAG TPA: sulfite exporter TauE/SafE family protein [Alphaproteobacteria bacterium]|nr:sulfite exporter TauE/SafE family protein [Alphaproteobacteria bacterium]